MREKIRRTTVAVVGAVLCVAGLALMVLPGPGLLLVLSGLVLLSQQFTWAQRLVRPVRHRAMQAARESVAGPWRIAASVLCGAALLGAGVVWMLVPSLPFSGVGTGLSLIVSGLALLALLVYSHRLVRRGHAHERTPQRARS